MNGDLGKQYLKDYVKKTSSIYNKYLSARTREARKFGPTVEKTLLHFKELATQGKRIRGALVTLGYQIAGNKLDQKILDTSLFIELFQTGILIHDDIMDIDDFRRGIQTFHKLFEKYGKDIKVQTDYKHYGESMAINAGDIGLFLAFEKLAASTLPPDRVTKTIQLFSNYVIKVGYGQILDVTNIPIKQKSEKDILEILLLKSTHYTSLLPMLAGTTLGGLKDSKKEDLVKKYCVALGWAFQIQDDMLSVYGDEKVTGKPIGSDLEKGKNTLLILHLNKHGSRPQKAFLRQVLGNPGITKAKVEKMREIFKEAGSYDYVINLGWKYIEEGKRYIRKITPDKKIQDVLESLIVYMMERTM